LLAKSNLPNLCSAKAPRIATRRNLIVRSKERILCQDGLEVVQVEILESGPS
jgi:hypothetical protein